MEYALNVKQMGYLVAAFQFLLLPVTGAVAAQGQSGIASVYSTESGSHTASGARLNPGALTAAHRSFPFGSQVRVTNRANGRSVVVTINDRGPFVRGRVIDLTPAGARALGFSGLAPVTIERE
jgi:rare lipoprotein A